MKDNVLAALGVLENEDVVSNLLKWSSEVEIALSPSVVSCRH